MSTHFAAKIDSKPISAREFADLFLGKKIGKGMSREVYEHRQDKTLIIKYEIGKGFQNIIEWTIWEAVQDTPMAKWFAPCIDISPNGRFLIMKKAEQIPKHLYPEKVPQFFTDLKYQNFGMINKKFVCIDYGLTNFINNVFTKKFRKADWWEE